MQNDFAFVQAVLRLSFLKECEVSPFFSTFFLFFIVRLSNPPILLILIAAVVVLAQLGKELSLLLLYRKRLAFYDIVTMVFLFEKHVIQTFVLFILLGCGFDCQRLLIVDASQFLGPPLRVLNLFADP